MKNQNCAYDEVIILETECRVASERLGLSFQWALNTKRYPAGCCYNTKNQETFFNEKIDIATTTPGYYGYYAGVCKKTGSQCYQ